MDTLAGAIERITYHNPESGYTVIKLLPDGKRRLDATDREGLVTVVGVMPSLSVGESIDMTGQWVNDPRFGKQFKTETVIPVLPTSKRGITRYLASGIVTGIGEKTAARIVDHFGVHTLDVLDRHPERLDELTEIKPALLKTLKETWRELQLVRETMIFLQTYGITARTATKIYQTYGEGTVTTIQNNPHQLAEDVNGIGFVKADELAQRMGVAHDAPGRLRAGLTYALTKLAQEGHVFAPLTLLLATTRTLLGLNNEVDLNVILEEQVLNEELRRETLAWNAPLPALTVSSPPLSSANPLGNTVMGEDGEEIILSTPEPEIVTPDIVSSLDAVYMPMYYFAERGAARRLKGIANTPSQIQVVAKKIKWKSFLSKLAADNNVDLTPTQQGAVQSALTNKISVLTGGPGTGKTTTLRMVINALIEKDFRVSLASPTGRAAKRLSEATDQPASTIHRLLGYSMEGFQHDEDDPLKTDMVIVDESSMLDVMLFNQLLRALTPETHLMLVGDVDQLPSVGAGNVLRDVIESKVGYVTRLDQIFRQNESSYITVNADRINRGLMPIFETNTKDFFLFRIEDAQACADMVVDVVKNRLPAKFGFEPMDKIQVIAPMYRGAAGVHNLNEMLQAALNGSAHLAQKKLHERIFRVGDKVMQTRNNYDKEVFNGDIGRLRAIDFENSLFEVVIDGRIIEYNFAETDELIHAYCISTHRSQGSEYPVVVMPLVTQHYMMLQRNLLYTAITRAKQVVVLVGTNEAIQMAVRNNKVAMRYSGLQARLAMK